MDYSKHSSLINANKEADPESFNEIKEKAIVDAIRNGDKSLGIPKRTENEELAQLRKAVKYLFEQHFGNNMPPEFADYFHDVEYIKQNFAKSINKGV